MKQNFIKNEWLKQNNLELEYWGKSKTYLIHTEIITDYNDLLTVCVNTRIEGKILLHDDSDTVSHLPNNTTKDIEKVLTTIPNEIRFKEDCIYLNTNTDNFEKDFQQYTNSIQKIYSALKEKNNTKLIN